jgi:hypothetical protein
MTITHRAEDYPDLNWQQPNDWFSHRDDWEEWCSLCTLDLVGNDVGGEG